MSTAKLSNTPLHRDLWCRCQWFKSTELTYLTAATTKIVCNRPQVAISLSQSRSKAVKVTNPTSLDA